MPNILLDVDKPASAKSHTKRPPSTAKPCMKRPAVNLEPEDRLSKKCGRSLYIVDHFQKADVFGLRRNFVGDRKQIATIRSSTLSVDKKRQLGGECVAKLVGGDSEEAVKLWLQTQLDS